MSDSYKIYASQEYVDGRVGEIAGLPEGATAYQQLVTDGDGNTKWEDRTHYKHTRIAIMLNPKNDSYNDSLSCYVGGAGSNDSKQVTAANAIGAEIWTIQTSGGGMWVFYWDGVRYEVAAKRLPVNVYLNSSNTWPFGYKVYSKQGNVTIEVFYNDNQEHTLEWEVINPELKQLSEEYIPTTIPRTETASVGQLVAVKAVDENGKPTEWEAVNSIPSTSDANMQLVTDMNNNVVWEERLGYKNIGEVTFFEESEMYPESADIHYHYGYSNANEFIIGETYKVNFDGTLYECIAYNDEFHGICLGNMSLTNDPVYEDTGEPFLFTYIRPNSAIPCQIPNGSADHYYVVSVVGPAIVTQEIPGEYIAGGLYKGSADRSFQVQEAEASQMGAIALGTGSVSDGIYSITVGADTTTKNVAAYSIAAGYGTISTAQAQVVHGKYNIEDTEHKYAHIVGNGKRQYGVTTASNAYTLNWDGTGWFANGIKTGGASQDDEDAETVVTAKNDPQPHQHLTTDVDGNKVWEDKLCYYNVEEVEIFKEASTDGAGGAQLTIENSCSTEEGVACIVTFDGVEYVCYPYEIPDFNTVWGNPSLMGGAVDSGEPFCCSGLTTEMMSIIKFKEAIPHTFSAKSQKRIYQTIDPAYIPFNVKSGEGENSVIIAAEMGSASGLNAVSLNGATATGIKATAVNAAAAEGDCSFSQGYMTHANGYCSAAFGGGTIASGEHQLAIGRGNVADTDSKYALIVGNAPIDEDGYVDRDQSSNAHTIDWQGNAWFQGSVYVGGTDQGTNSEKLMTQSEVATMINEALAAFINGEEVSY